VPLTALLETARRLARTTLPRSSFATAAETYNAFVGARKLGLKEYRRLRDSFPDRSTPDESVIQFSIPDLMHPIFVRRGTGDAIELVSSCLRLVYGQYLPSPPIGLILDAGAFIGDTTAWYLSRFRDAKVIALEPDPANFAMVERNCSAYGARAALLNAALWSRRSQLALPAGRTATSDVSVAATNDATRANCVGLSPMDVLEMSGKDAFDIFKCDIEGAEVELFSSDCDPWLSRTRSLYVDIHSRQAHEVVVSATRRHGFVCRPWRELLIFNRD
jgi:FkbM family methyltransferase